MFVSHPIAEPTLDLPDVIVIQPVPVMTRVVPFHVGGRTITAIMRHWKPGDSGPGGRCRLCPKCNAYDDGCLIQVNRPVDRDSAALFSTAAFTWQRQNSGMRVATVPKVDPPEPEPKAETWRDRPPLS